MTFINFIYIVRKSIIYKQEHKPIHQIKHKTWMQPAQELVLAFLLSHRLQRVYETCVLRSIFLGLGQNLGEADVDWVGEQGADEVGCDEHRDTSCVRRLDVITVLVVQEGLQFLQRIVVSLGPADSHELHYLRD